VRSRLCAAIAASLVLACCASEQRYTLSVRSAVFTVEVADTPETRSRGLMHRTELGEREGMLFVFPDSALRSFWMKDTLIALSIAYIDEQLVIREIHDMEPRSTAAVASSVPARYALEVNRGAFARSGVRVGDRLVLSSELERRLAR